MTAYAKAVNTTRISSLDDLSQVAADLEMIINHLLKEGAEEFRVIYDKVDDTFVVHALQHKEPITYN